MPQQTDTIDEAFRRFELLLTEVEKFADTLFTESDTRIKIILSAGPADVTVPKGLVGLTKKAACDALNAVGLVCAPNDQPGPAALVGKVVSVVDLGQPVARGTNIQIFVGTLAPPQTTTTTTTSPTTTTTVPVTTTT